MIRTAAGVGGRPEAALTAGRSFGADSTVRLASVEIEKPSAQEALGMGSADHRGHLPGPGLARPRHGRALARAPRARPWARVAGRRPLRAPRRGHPLPTAGDL